MRTRITLNTFRKVARAEEQVARAMMPRVSAADPARPERAEVRNTVATARTLTYRIGEVAR